MTREQTLLQAVEAADKAKNLAEQAQSAAHSLDRHHQAERYAAASAAWADVARSYAAIAELMSETETADA